MTRYNLTQCSTRHVAAVAREAVHAGACRARLGSLSAPSGSSHKRLHSRLGAIRTSHGLGFRVSTKLNPKP